MIKPFCAAGILAVSISLVSPAVAWGQGVEMESAPTGVEVDPKSDTANWREVHPDNLLKLTINGGDVLVELRPDFAPLHVERVQQIVRNGHYDGLPFHRVIDDFMAQGGEVRSVYPDVDGYGPIEPEFVFRRSPTEKPMTRPGTGANLQSVGYIGGFVVGTQSESIAPLMADASVNSWILHCPGIASMARADAPNSADTQFFLMRGAQSQLDQNYTAWGRVLTGLDIVRGIKAGPTEMDGRLPPDQADRLMRAALVSDLHPMEQVRVFVERTDGAAFKARLANTNIPPNSNPCGWPQAGVITEEPTGE